MLNNLILKEIKERKVIILFGFLLCLVPFISKVAMELFRMAGQKTVTDVYMALQLLFFVILIFVYPIILSAPAISSEIEKRTLPCLLSLPLSRNRIWFNKLISIIIMQYTMTFFYLLINIRSQFFQKLTGVFAGPDSSAGILIMLLLPVLSISISLFISPLFFRETEAMASSFIFLFFLGASFSFITRNLIWNINPGHTSVIILMTSGIFLYGSRAMFQKGELLTKPFRVLLTGIRYVAIPFIAMGMLVWGFYYSYNNFLFETLVTTEILDRTGNKNVLIGLHYKTASDSIGILSLETGGIKKIPLRSIYSYKLSPDKSKIVLLRRNAPSSKENSMKSEVWLYDINSGKIFRLRQTFKRGNRNELFWIDNERFILTTISEFRNTAELYSTETGKIKEIPLPEIKQFELQQITSNRQDKNSVYAFYHSTFFYTCYNTSINPEGRERLRIIKIDINTGKYGQVADITAEKGEHIYSYYNQSPYQPFLSLYKSSNNYSKNALYIYDIEKNKILKRIPSEGYGEISHLYWLGKDLGYYNEYINGTTLNKIVNPATGEEKILFSETDNKEHASFLSSANHFYDRKTGTIIILKVHKDKEESAKPVKIIYYNIKNGRQEKTVDFPRVAQLQPCIIGPFIDRNTIILTDEKNLYRMNIATGKIDRIYPAENRKH